MRGGEQTPDSKDTFTPETRGGGKPCYTTVSPAVPSAAARPTGLIIPERRYLTRL